MSYGNRGGNGRQDNQKNALAQFRRTAIGSARTLLVEWVGKERAAEAEGRIVAAFTASAMSARNPADFMACTQQSIGQCVAISALTGIMPGTGSASLAYLVPRRPRRGEQPQLNYQLSHRGICALARRAGTVIVAVPVHHDDLLEISYGEVSAHEQDPDKPPMDWGDLRGCIVIVKAADTGAILFRGWTPLRVIGARRDKAMTQKVWNEWPVEMAMKTAIHYAISRGWAVVDDTEAVRALSMDAASTTRIDVTPEAVPQGVSPELRNSLPDGGEPEPIFARQPSDERQRETVDRTAPDRTTSEQRSEHTPNASPRPSHETMSLTDMKKAARAIDADLPLDIVEGARKRCGVELPANEPITKWGGGPKKTAAYLAEIRNVHANYTRNATGEE